MRTKAGVLGTVLLLALTLAACSSSKTTAAPPAPSVPSTDAGTGMNESACKAVGDMSAAKATIDVTEKEWSITSSTNRTPHGLTHFAVKNEGKEKHELAIFAGAPATLITLANGAIDEASLAEGALLGRVAVAAGQSCDLTVDLPKGDATLACNLVENMGKGEVHVHYALGMSQSLVVT